MSRVSAKVLDDSEYASGYEEEDTAAEKSITIQDDGDNERQAEDNSEVCISL
jgi:hypothetical protein